MLEKILEEIEGALKKMYLEVANNYDISDLHYDGDKVACVASRCRKVAIQLIKEIFQKHMNDLSVKEYISRQEAINVVMQGYRYESDRMTALQELPIFYMNDGKDTNVPTNDGWIPVEIAPPPIGQRLQATIKHHKWIADYDSDWVPEEEKTVHPEWTEVCEIVSIGAMWFYYCKGTDYEKEIAYIAPLKDLSVPVDEIIAWRTLPESYRPEKGEN